MKEISVYKIMGRFDAIDLARVANHNADMLGALIEGTSAFVKNQAKFNRWVSVDFGLMLMLIYLRDQHHKQNYKRLAAEIDKLKAKKNTAAEETEM